jgi:hypothetical protein
MSSVRAVVSCVPSSEYVEKNRRGRAPPAVIYTRTVISPTLWLDRLLVHRPPSDDTPDIALERASGVA